MKKNYTVGLLTFLLSITLYAQDVVFDFETDQNLLGWVEGGGNIGSATIVSEGLAIDWDGTGLTNRKPRIKHLNANIDASIQKYVEVKLINNSNELTRVRILHFRGGDGTDPTNTGGAHTRYTSIDILPNTGSESYTFDLTNAQWTNYNAATDDDADMDMDHIWIQFVTANPANGPLTLNSATDGNVIIQKVSFLSDLPSTERTTYSFDDTSDSEGFVGANGISLTQPTSGEIELDMNDQSPYPKFEQQAGYYNVNADTYKYCRITLRNNSSKDRLNFVAPEGGNQFTGIDILANDSSSQFYDINLNEGTNTEGNPVFTNWTGVQPTWALQIVESNPAGGAPIPSTGTIVIEEIIFSSESLSTASVNLISVKLYPNPSNGLITIDSPLRIQGIKAINLLGQVMINQEANSNSLDTSSLKAGIYILEINQENGVISTKRFIKK